LAKSSREFCAIGLCQRRWEISEQSEKAVLLLVSVGRKGGDRLHYLSTVRIAPLQYGISLVEAVALFPNPVYTDMVELIACLRPLELIVFGGGIVGQSALGFADGGGELELVAGGLWLVDAVVRVVSVELVVGGTELVVGSALEVDETDVVVD
jgi:hypothetical protein